MKFTSKFIPSVNISNTDKSLFDNVIQKSADNGSLPKSTKAWEDYIKNLDGASDSLKEFLQNQEYGTKDLANFTIFLKKQEGGLKGFGNTMKGIGKLLGSIALNLGIDALMSLIGVGISKLMTMEADALKAAQEAYEKSSEQVDKIREKEELVFSSTKELTELLEAEDWVIS